MKHFNETKASAPEDFQSDGADSPSSLTNEWLTTNQAAQYLGIPIKSLLNMTSNGRVPYYKFGKLNRYRLPELRQLLLSGKRGSPHGL